MRRAKPSYSFLENAIEACREKFGEAPTQAQLAALLGIKQPSVNGWRKTRARPEHVEMLALKTGHCVQWLYNRNGPRHPWDAQAQGDAKMQDLMSIWNQLSDEGKSRLLGAGVTLLQDFRAKLPSPKPDRAAPDSSPAEPPTYHARPPETD